MQVYKLPAGIVPILVPTNADHLKQESNNSPQVQLQGHSNNSNTIANNSSSIPTMIQENNDPSNKNTIQTIDPKGVIMNAMIQSVTKTSEIISSNPSILGEKGLKIELIQKGSASESTGSLLQHPCEASQAPTQYLPATYIPEKSQLNLSTVPPMNPQNLVNANLNSSSNVDIPASHVARTNETQILPPVGVENRIIDNIPSNQSSMLQPTTNELDSQSSFAGVYKENDFASHGPLTQVEMNASQTVKVSETHLVDKNIVQPCAVSSEHRQQIASRAESQSHQQLCETCGSISVVGESAGHKTIADYHDNNAIAGQSICNDQNVSKCDSPNPARAISKPALIAPQNTPVHPVKSYTTQTHIIDVDVNKSDQITSISSSSFISMDEKMATNKEEKHEESNSCVSGHTVSGDTIDVFTETIPMYQNGTMIHFIFYVV